VHHVVAGLAAALRASENLRKTERLLSEARQRCLRAEEQIFRAELLRTQTRIIRALLPGRSPE